MSTTTRIGGATLAVTLLLALPIVGSAYEVTILDGRGAESKALNDGKYDIAIQRIEARLKDRRHNRDILLTNLCTALIITRDLQKAHAVCDEAVASDGPFVGTAYNSRGVLHALMLDFMSASTDFAEAGKKTNYPPAPIDTGSRPGMGKYNTPSRNMAQATQLAAANREAAVEMASVMQARGPSRDDDE